MAQQTKILLTFATASYSPQLQVMLRSFNKFNPDYQQIVYSPDIKEIRGLESCEVRKLEIGDNGLSVAECFEMLRSSTILSLLNELENGDQIFYCDADVQHFIQLPAFSNYLTVTPHRFFYDVQGSVLNWIKGGFINGGMYNIAKTETTVKTFKILKLIAEGKPVRGINRHVTSGQFWQQTTFNFLPFIHRGLDISTESGLNVAYWNLDERKLALDDDGDWVTNGRPLINFHFSGFDKPERLTKYSHDPTPKHLLPLFEQYEEKLSEFR